MLRPHMGRARTAASLALAMLLIGTPAAASAAEDDGSFGGELFSGFVMEGDSDESGSESEIASDLAALGIVEMRSFGHQLRVVAFDVLGTATVGGVILHQLTGARRMAAPGGARMLPTLEGLTVSGDGGAQIDDVTVTVTPEPGTVMLMASGLALLGVLSYRRARRVPRRLPLRSSHRR